MRLSLPAAALALTALAGSAALAHHGWSWAVDEQSQLEGVVQSVSMAPPHPSLQVRANDGAVWRIDLGNPGLTSRSGFRAASAPAGTRVLVTGNRSRNPSERLMKAVRLTIDGRNYDIYPDRIRTN